MSILLTIVICTYNRSRYLENCLLSLAEQSVDTINFEVLVVDNNSSDETLRVANKYKNFFKNYKVVTEHQNGLSYARNRGAKEASGDWVAYIDDDGFVNSDFVFLANMTISEYDFDMFGGVVIDVFERKKPNWLNFPLYPRLGESSVEGIIKLEKNTIFGCIMCIRKSLVLSYKFDNSLGMKGNKIGFSEESEFQNRIRNDGYVVGQNPILVLNHTVMPSKYKIFWHIKSQFYLGQNYWIKEHRIPNIIFDILFGPFKIIGLLLLKSIYSLTKIVKKDFHLGNYILNILQPTAYGVGKWLSAFDVLFKNRLITEAK
ncbi:glycosyltransferase family 2 protein [Celerinatantimonas sp. MCCC 1A17872]|uniref:glycosyltransferase family 2 protein n=1 Tax=Celerinatantimonas sp. MCCC 1A17872 TaxID=3177514 RepID=UPI0038CB8DB0